MPTFSTPEPISVTVQIEVGAPLVVESDRDDTDLDGRPSNQLHLNALPGVGCLSYTADSVVGRAPMPRQAAGFAVSRRFLP